MQQDRVHPMKNLPHVVLATDEAPVFHAGDVVQVRLRWPIGHYRVPRYLRGRTGLLERVVTPRELDNEEEGFGRNAGVKRHYYRVSFAMREVWPDYAGPARDRLLIEVFETWLKAVDP